jgi:hypothetical protein
MGEEKVNSKIRHKKPGLCGPGLGLPMGIELGIYQYFRLTLSSQVW